MDRQTLSQTLRERVSNKVLATVGSVVVSFLIAVGVFLWDASQSYATLQHGDVEHQREMVHHSDKLKDHEERLRKIEIDLSGDIREIKGQINQISDTLSRMEGRRRER